MPFGRARSIAKSVPLYGSELWGVARKDMNRLATFHNGFLRKLCRVFWPNTISNEDIYTWALSQDIILKIKRRRLRWLRHALRKGEESIQDTSREEEKGTVTDKLEIGGGWAEVENTIQLKYNTGRPGMML